MRFWLSRRSLNNCCQADRQLTASPDCCSFARSGESGMLLLRSLAFALCSEKHDFLEVSLWTPQVLLRVPRPRRGRRRSPRALAMKARRCDAHIRRYLRISERVKTWHVRHVCLFFGPPHANALCNNALCNISFLYLYCPLSGFISNRLSASNWKCYRS